MLPPAGTVEVRTGKKRHHLSRLESDTNYVVLVNAADDRTIPQCASTNFGRISVSLNNQEIIFLQLCPRDFGLCRSQRLNFAEVKEATENIGDSEVGYFAWEVLTGAADLQSALHVCNLANLRKRPSFRIRGGGAAQAEGDRFGAGG